ncbi:MAG TPA: transposase [Ferruginibacter sp.]|nr:transposase [Bacteroidota bacterium]MBS1925217.1 transposase [Bacteroidota bacterium]MCC6692137.1 transposase [Chitinophagaceae bacterium]HMT97247.1 transposase [Ferruginibacter sp.]HMU24105.1 transposase [Ferruginibacter sp.]
MSRKYKFRNNDKLFFVTLTITNWLDLFIRDEYREIFIHSVQFCQKEKELEVYGWCIMTSHIHMIIGSRGNLLSNIMRDLKRHTSEKLHEAIKYHPQESRREWITWMMERAAAKKANGSKFQLWQQESHPQELMTNAIAHQKLAYIHDNPVEAGFVKQPPDWKYSSAADYNGAKGLIEVTKLEPLLIV